jgi:hypothetical protein
MVGLVLGIGVEETGRSEDRERHGCEEASEFFLMCFFLLSLWLLLWAVAGVAVARLCVFWFFWILENVLFLLCLDLDSPCVVSHHHHCHPYTLHFPPPLSCHIIRLIPHAGFGHHGVLVLSLSLSHFIFFLLSCTNRMSMRVWFHFRLSLIPPSPPISPVVITVYHFLMIKMGGVISAVMDGCV